MLPIPDFAFVELAGKWLMGAGSIASFLWITSRMLRRLSGLAIYGYMTGVFLMILAVLIVTGFIDVNLQRFRRAGRLAVELYRALSRVAVLAP